MTTTSRVLICRRCTQPYALGANDDVRLCPTCRAAPKTKREPKPMAEKRCPICNSVFVQRSNEGPSDFARRTFCTKICASKSRGARYDHVLRPSTPQKPAEPRTASAAPPRPRIATQPLCQPQQARGTGLGVIPKKRKPMPTVDPLLCVWPARAIWAPDGRAIALGLHAFGATAEILVRGWATTVPDDADEYVTPCFETAGAAKLWDAICDHKLGRSTVAAAALTKAELAKAEAGR